MRTAAKSKRFLSRAEVAEIFEVSPNTVARWARSGKLPYVITLGGRRRYDRLEIMKLADDLVRERGAKRNT